MKLLCYLTPAIATLLLSGCLSFPQTPDSFRTSAAAKLDFSVDRPLRDSYELVAKNSIRCHQGNASSMATIGGAFFSFPSGSTKIEGTIDESQGSASIDIHFSNVSVDGLLQVIDFKRGSANKTEIAVYRLNDSKKWRTATESVKAWFDGGQECYDLL